MQLFIKPIKIEDAETERAPNALRNDASFVYCVREIGPGGGVTCVACKLDRAFHELGGTSDSFTLRDLGFDRFTFLGVVSNTDQVIKAADALILSGIFEAWPLVRLEAMAGGLSVLIKPTGGIPDFSSNRIQLRSRHAWTSFWTIPRTGNAWAAAHATTKQYSWRDIACRYLALFTPPA